MVSFVISSIMVSAWLWKVSDMAGRFIFINDSNEENIVFSNHPATPLYLTCRDCPIYGALPARFLELEHEIDYKPPLEQQRQLRQTTLAFHSDAPGLIRDKNAEPVSCLFQVPDPLCRSARPALKYRKIDASMARQRSHSLGSGVLLAYHGHGYHQLL